MTWWFESPTLKIKGSLFVTSQHGTRTKNCNYCTVILSRKYSLYEYYSTTCLVCVHVWCSRLYNVSCEEELFLQSGPTLCCTLDNVPLIRSVSLPPWTQPYLSLSVPLSLFCLFVSSLCLVKQEHCPIVSHDPCRHIVDKKASELEGEFS